MISFSRPLHLDDGDVNDYDDDDDNGDDEVEAQSWHQITIFLFSPDDPPILQGSISLMICLLFLQMDLSLPFVETDRWYWWYINLDQKLRARLILPSLCFPMGVLGMSFYRCVILISWQMSYILFLPIPPPHHCPHGPHQCPCAGPLGSRSFEPRSPNLTPGHPNTLLLLHLHLIRCFKNTMPKSALSPPLTSDLSHPPS